MSVRAPVPALVSGTVELTPETSHYLCRVLRLREGDRFVAFDPEAKREADAEVVTASGERAVAHVGDVRSAPVVALAPLVVVYGLPKGDKVDDVVRDCAELGATHVLVVETARSVSRLVPAKAAEKVARWRRVTEQAARQSGRADPPQVEGVLSWSEGLARAATLASARYCLWENATAPLAPPLLGALARGEGVAFAIGPEGGLTGEEVAQAEAEGFRATSIGPFVLRTETVAAAVLGAVRIFSTR